METGKFLARRQVKAMPAIKPEKTLTELKSGYGLEEIIRLNSTASDSTKTLEERLKAKNKVVEIQNNLSKKTLDDLEDEIKLLEGLGASEKEIEKVKKKLNSEKIKATRLSENNAKAQSKLAQSYADSTDNMKLLDKGTGGLITKFNLLIANPIVAILPLISTFPCLINSSACLLEQSPVELIKLFSLIPVPL